MLGIAVAICRTGPTVGAYYRLRLGENCNLLKAFVSVALAAICLGGRESSVTLSPRAISSPAPPATLVPQLTRLSHGRVALSWQERLKEGGYRFSFAIRDAKGWSVARTIAIGPNLSMFTADLPGIAELPDGALLAYWELKDMRDGDRYATAIQTAVSRDDGRTWTRPKQPYPDALSGQHSFLSWFHSADGVGLVWLDAEQRSLVRHAEMHESRMGSVGLRFADLNANGDLTQQSFINPITCECCPTGSAVSGRGPVVVYRGRQEPPGTKPSEVQDDRPTVRDIYITRLDNGKWTKPHVVYPDNWVINACPDNGPSVDASANNLVVGWWTRSNDAPKVQVAFSADAGDSLGKPVRVDAGNGEGQVTVALLPDGRSAIVGWLEDGQTCARYVASSGMVGNILKLGASPRHSRLPAWLSTKDGVIVAWTAKAGDGTQVEVANLAF